VADIELLLGLAVLLQQYELVPAPVPWVVHRVEVACIHSRCFLLAPNTDWELPHRRSGLCHLVAAARGHRLDAAELHQRPTHAAQRIGAWRHSRRPGRYGAVRQLRHGRRQRLHRHQRLIAAHMKPTNAHRKHPRGTARCATGHWQPRPRLDGAAPTGRKACPCILAIRTRRAG
jgi:hypothetical protein